MRISQRAGQEIEKEEKIARETHAQTSELWECALNYKIRRNILESSEEEAWARLLSCSMFSKRGARSGEQTAAKKRAGAVYVIR